MLVNNPPRVAFITLGCAKNEADTRHMRDLLSAAGISGQSDPEDADVVVVNTCSFITDATQEAIDTILDAAELDNVKSGRARLVVTGCMPSRYGMELAGELPEVAAFVNVADEDKIVDVVAGASACLLGDTLRHSDTPLRHSDIPLRHSGLDPESTQGVTDAFGDDPESTQEVAAGNHFTRPSDTPLRHSGLDPESTQEVAADNHSARPSEYVKISDGCSRKCSFCTIPYIRGPYVGRSYEDIVAEAGKLIDAGTKEIVLIGQDTSVWSGTIDGAKADLSGLLDALAKRFPDTWLRVMYLQPEGITDGLLKAIYDNSNICSYLDIPLQHANARILKDMNRAGSGEEYLRLLGHIRDSVPGVTLRTTLIAGFPGESEGDAAELECFIDSAGFDYAGVFPYSTEDGTPAGERKDQVPMRTRDERAQRVRDHADVIGFRRAAAHVDTTLPVLICGQDEEGVYGRTQGQAPEVDGVTYVDGATANMIGTVVNVEIYDSVCYDLYGEMCADTGETSMQ